MLLLICIMVFPSYGLSQMPKKPPILPITSDLPFIQCEVCQKSSKALYKLIKQKREEIKPLKLGEEEIQSIIEKLCDPESSFGEWLTKLDIVESNGSLKVQEHDKVGKCREECKTIARSCEDTIGDIDTDLGEILWRNEMKLSAFMNEACHQLSSACKKNRKQYISGKRNDFKFIEMTEKDVEAQKLMKSMSGMPGMPGMEMYTREDLESMREQLGINPNDEPTQEYTSNENAQQTAYQTDQQPSTLGFFDTVKAMGSDVIGKIKRLFGYNRKSEL